MALSKKTTDTLSQAQDWTSSQLSILQESRKTAWVIASVSGGVAVLTLIAALLIWVRMSAPVNPGIIEVNQLTGAVQRINIFDVERISSIESLQKYFAAKYVRCRESYFFEQLNLDYQCAMKMSEAQALNSYSEVYSGDDARHKVLKASQRWEIEIGNVQFDPQQNNVLIVPYTKIVRSGGTAPQVAQFVPRLTFRFVDNTTGDAPESFVNPVGFKVGSYVTDADLKR